MRRKYNDLLAKRAGMLTEAETLLKDGKREDYKSKMAEIGNINDEITEVKAFIDEQDRQFLERKDDPGEEKDKAAERGNTLMKGGSIALSAQEVRKGLYLASKSVTLATTTLVSFSASATFSGPMRIFMGSSLGTGKRAGSASSER